MDPRKSDFEGAELAEWLQEAGRRRPPARAAENVVLSKRVKRALITNGKRLCLFALVALAYLQYFYLDVYLQINELPSLIIFVPPGLALG